MLRHALKESTILRNQDATTNMPQAAEW